MTPLRLHFTGEVRGHLLPCQNRLGIQSKKPITLRAKPEGDIPLAGATKRDRSEGRREIKQQWFAGWRFCVGLTPYTRNTYNELVKLIFTNGRDRLDQSQRPRAESDRLRVVLFSSISLP